MCGESHMIVELLEDKSCFKSVDVHLARSVAKRLRMVSAQVAGKKRKCALARSSGARDS
jgi:hypothetical protein